ncbi:MAG: helix-turn-helix domain-containing protein [Clostridia bacterium]|nr:helix-turn-helix domain-containing protein [Clostridia bacterium]
MNIGEKLYELRKGKNLSQEEVAEKLNVTRQTVSKWETNQSSPDFDKILPICELFEISTEELITGKKTKEKNNENEEMKKDVKEEKENLTRDEIRIKSAEIVSTSVFLYILDIVILVLSIAWLELDPILVVSIFLILIAIATTRIIKHYMSIPKIQETKEEEEETELQKQINSIVYIISTIIYFLVSFGTYAWHISWIIFVIAALVCQVIKLFFMLNEKEDKEDE